MLEESLNCELKREYTDDIKKTVIAFANTNGGDIYIGVQDDGKVCGVKNTDEIMLKVTSSIHDNISPDVTSITNLTVSKIDSKKVIIIHIERGTSRPYYLNSKGIRPEGVFVRLGSATIPASKNAILKMIKETSNDSFERGRALSQSLTFKYTENEFKKRNIIFKDPQKHSLHLKDSDNLYTNLAWLLSDQCDCSLRMAVFQDTNKSIFKDRLEINASVLEQLEKAYEYIEKNNRIRAEFNGLHRIDSKDYPEEAVRESLLNAIVHRDYSYNSPILISLFDDRLEILNIGGLLSGMSFEDIMIGVSSSRNSNLANIFYRLKLVESYGVGISKIMNAYSDFSIKPKIEIGPNSFKITLPNKNYHREKELSVVSNPDFQNNNLSDTEKEVVKYLKSNSKASRIAIQNAIGKSQTTTILILKGLLQKKIIKRQGNNRSFIYIINN